MQKKTRCSEDRNYLAWLPICANCALFPSRHVWEGLLDSVLFEISRKEEWNKLAQSLADICFQAFLHIQARVACKLWDESLNGRFANVAAISSGHWWWSRYLWCEPTHPWLRASGARREGKRVWTQFDNRWVNWGGSDMCVTHGQSVIDWPAS